MRSKDPGLMARIPDIVNEFFFSEHRMPSVKEVADRAGISKSSAHRYLVEMNSRGLLTYRAGEILTDKISGLGFSTVNAPLLGGIACGEPVEEEARMEDFVPLPSAIFGSGDMFILRAYGDSMINAGISSGDFVVIRRQETARVGDIVAALVDHHESTLKRLLFDKEKNRRYLHPENEQYEDMYFNEIEIQGVLANVIKTGPF